MPTETQVETLDDPLALLLLVEAFDDELLQQRLVSGVAPFGQLLQPLDREFVEAYGDRGCPAPSTSWSCRVSAPLSLARLGQFRLVFGLVALRCLTHFFSKLR